MFICSTRQIRRTIHSTTIPDLLRFTRMREFERSSTQRPTRGCGSARMLEAEKEVDGR